MGCNSRKKVYKNNKKEFYIKTTNICNKIFQNLREKNNMDSVLASITQKHSLPKNYIYNISIDHLSIAFKKNNYISIYPFPNDEGTNKPCIIGGSLQNNTNQNLIAAIMVSIPSDYSYRIEFSLHLENKNRKNTILLSMFPVLLLSVLSIASIIILFYITFSNWIKQKKLAEMQSDFINSITHEFNTPLTAILIANKSLQNEKLVNQDSNTKLLTSIIQRQSDRLNALFKQVLNLTITNEQLLNKKRYDIGLLTDEIVSDYRLKIKESNINLTFNNHTIEETILLDKFWFTTMLQNLIENAFKYNNKSTKEVTIQLESQENDICLIIKDNGIGISEKTQKHIFEKFYRNRNELPSTRGLGLGLFYARQCIFMHNWNITIESTVEIGTEFIIKMPKK